MVELNKAQSKMLKDLNTPWKMWLFFFKQLPSIIFYNIKVKEISLLKTTIVVPFKWRTKNPFKSIYAGAQFAAAEISTGLMASVAISGKGKISMLITEVHMEYSKKAKTTTTFTCGEGQLLLDTIDKMISSGEPQTVQLLTIGTQKDGAIVSKMKFTWSFKLRS